MSEKVNKPTDHPVSIKEDVAVKAWEFIPDEIVIRDLDSIIFTLVTTSNSLEKVAIEPKNSDLFQPKRLTLDRTKSGKLTFHSKSCDDTFITFSHVTKPLTTDPILLPILKVRVTR